MEEYFQQRASTDAQVYKLTAIIQGNDANVKREIEELNKKR